MNQLFGLTNREKRLHDYCQTVKCPCCGAITNAEIVVTYYSVTLFFFDILSFNKKYFVQMKCCGAFCEIDKNNGRAAERGRPVMLRSEGMIFEGSRFTQCALNQKTCPNCGFTTLYECDFCPKCGHKI